MENCCRKSKIGRSKEKKRTGETVKNRNRKKKKEELKLKNWLKD